MWLGLFVFLFFVVAIVGSIVSGGIFTIVLLPLAVIAAVSAMVYSGLGRGAQAKADGPKSRGRRRAEKPLPHSRPADPANHQPATPDQLVDARQRQ